MLLEVNSIFSNKYFERIHIVDSIKVPEKKINQAICSTTHHSLQSFPLHFACLPVDLSWNINYVDE